MELSSLLCKQHETRRARAGPLQESFPERTKPRLAAVSVTVAFQISTGSSEAPQPCSSPAFFKIVSWFFAKVKVSLPASCCTACLLSFGTIGSAAIIAKPFVTSPRVSAVLHRNYLEPPKIIICKPLNRRRPLWIYD